MKKYTKVVLPAMALALQMGCARFSDGVKEVCKDSEDTIKCYGELIETESIMSTNNIVRGTAHLNILRNSNEVSALQLRKAGYKLVKIDDTNESEQCDCKCE